MKDRNIIDYLSMLCLGVYLLFFCYLFADISPIELIDILGFIVMLGLYFAPHIILMNYMFKCKSFVLKVFMFMVQFGLTIFLIYELYQTTDPISLVILPLFCSCPIVAVTLGLKDFIQYKFKNSKLFNE